MQITFDTTTITDDEVRGIFALLDTVRPEAFDTGEEKLPTFTSEDGNFSIDPNTRTVTVSGAGISVKPDENGNTVSTISADQFVLPKTEGEPFTMEGGKVVPETAEAAAVVGAPTPPATDASGLPWDERIHSGTKALNADGTWRTKRGVDKALVASVEEELRQTEASDESDPAGRIEAAQTVTVAPPAPPAPPAPTYAPEAELPAAAQAAKVEVAPVPPSPAAATSPFVALMKRVTTAQGAGKLTAQRVKELLESLDKKSIMDLRTDTDALDAFAVLLDGEGV